MSKKKVEKFQIRSIKVCPNQQKITDLFEELLHDNGSNEKPDSQSVQIIEMVSNDQSEKVIAQPSKSVMIQNQEEEEEEKDQQFVVRQNKSSITKNFPTKLKRIFKNHLKTKDSQIYSKFEQSLNESCSMRKLSQLFEKPDLNPIFMTMFEERTFSREIINSSISSIENKEKYLLLLKLTEKKLKEGKLNSLL